MAKAKTYDEATANLDAAKTTLSDAKEVVRTFKTENKIRRNKPVEDEKVAKKLEALEAKVEKAREAMDITKEIAKDLKPRKDRVTKYEYPADCVSDKDKKKYRAKMRRDSKKADAPEGEDKAAKPSKKKVIKKSAPVAEETEEEEGED